MSNPIKLTRPRRAGLTLAVGLALAALPAAAQASPVDVGTAAPFAVLAGSAVSNSGPSVLWGDLGIAPATASSITGFGPATIHGDTVIGPVADQAQLDLGTAYDTAAGQPILSGDDLTDSDLGGMTLKTGAYKFSSEALLTGPIPLTFDAENDPDAQFVIEIGTKLTTGPGSSVAMLNGASPCNVYWQVGTSATLDTTTAFQGNLMALASISLENGASVQGRLLARNGAVTLINNVIDNRQCDTALPPEPTPTPTPVPTAVPPTPTPTPVPTAVPPNPTPAPPTATPAPPAPQGPLAPTPPASGAPSSPGSPSNGSASPVSGALPPASANSVPTRIGSARLRRTPGSSRSCTEGFSASVRGRQIKRVVFRLDGKRISSQTGSPFRVHVRALTGRHMITARVTFKDATRAKTMKLGYRACAAAVLTPRNGPSRFTG